MQSDADADRAEAINGLHIFGLIIKTGGEHCRALIEAVCGRSGSNDQDTEPQVSDCSSEKLIICHVTVPVLQPSQRDDGVLV